jgi:hypothetical protein
MTLPASGPISIGDVAAELGIGLPLSLGDPRVRTLAGVPSGPISLGQLRGKSVAGPLTVTAQNSSNSADTQFGSGVVTCNPSVYIAGGVDPKTCNWSILSNPGGATVAFSGPSATVQFSYASNSAGSATVTLRCTVTDGAGSQRTVDVTGTLQWASNAPPLSVTAMDDYNSVDTQFGGGTVSCRPAVNVAGGVDPKTFAWSILSNPRGATVALGSGLSATVQFTYTKNSTGSATVTLRCTVTDGAGTQRTVDVTGSLEWAGNL